MTKKYIELILRTNVENLKDKGERVKVSLGYARNYLLPNKKAQIVTPGLTKHLAQIKQKNIESKQELVIMYANLKKQLEAIGRFNIKKKASSNYSIFGSVSGKDIINLLIKNTGTQIKKNQIKLNEIKTIGIYPAEVHFTDTIIAKISIQVLPEDLD